MEGSGGYEDFARLVLTAVQAEAVIVVAVGGSRGSGFDVQVQTSDPIATVRALAVVLRDVAAQMERDADRLAAGVL